MTLQDLLQWWNLIYAAPLLVSLVWIAATVLTGAHGSGGHTHGAAHDIGHAAHDIGHAIGHAVGHGNADASHTHAGHSDGGTHTAHTHDVHSHHSHDSAQRENSGVSRFLALLGIGQVPITLIFGIFLLIWGAFGLLANQLFAAALKYPAIYIWPSLGVTCFVSLVATRFMIAIVARIMPATETYAISRLELVGSFGKTIFPTGESSGTVDIKDTYGTIHRVQAKIEAGQEVLSTGTEVIAIDFDEEDKRFVVRRSTI